MSNTISLILEVDDSGLVKVQNFEKKTTAASQNIGDASKKMGESGSGGFLALRMAAEKTAESLGVPGRAANRLGDAVADVARKKLPEWGAALGVAGLAVGAVTLLTTQFIEKKEAESKAREENIQKIRGEMSEMDQLRLKTVEMIAAQQRSSDVKKAELLLETPELIEAKRATLAKLEKSYADLGGQRDRAYSMLSVNQGGGGETALIDRLESKIARLGIQISRTKSEIGELGALVQGASGKGTSAADKGFREEQQTAYFQANESLNVRNAQQRMEAEKSFQQERINYMTAAGASEQDILKAERDMINRHYAEKVAALQQADATEAAINKVKDARAIANATLTLRREKQTDQLSLSNKAQVYGASAQLLDQAYRLSGEKYKAFFYLSRTAAAAESIIQGYLGASKAVGTFWGMEMAPVLIGMGYANAAMIMAQTFMGSGGSGGGGGAMPTYDANPVTGMATDSSTKMQPQAPVNITNIHVMGDVLDMDQFARKILPSVKKAEADGI